MNESSSGCQIARSARRWARRVTLVGLAVVGVVTAQAKPEVASRYFENALRRYDKGEYESASIELRNAIGEDAGMVAAHVLLGKVLLRTGDLKGAEAAFEKALGAGVSRNEVIVPLGQVYLMLGKARQVIDRLAANGLPSATQAEVHSLRGVAYAMLGNQVLATKSFADARQADPASVAPLMAEAPLLLHLGDSEHARTTALKATEIAPKNAAAWSTLGTVLHGSEDLRGALAAFDRALSLDKEQAEARIGRASVLVGLGRDKEASAELTELGARSIVDPKASYLAGVVASRTGDSVLAQSSYGKAATMIDGIAPDWLNGNDALQMTGALAHRALGNTAKSREYLEKLVAVNPRHYAARVLLATVYVDGSDFARATPLIESLSAINPRDAQLLYLKGVVEMARKRFVQASTLFESAIAITPTSDAWRELGIAQIALNNSKQGQTSLDKAQALNPADAKAAVQLVTVYARQGQHDKALQTAEAIVKRDAGNLTLLNFLGNVRAVAGDKRGARAAYEQVLAKDAQFRPAVINLSWVDIEEGRLDNARTRLTALLGKYKDDPDVLFQLGTVEQRAQRFDDALRWWERADSMQRRDPRPGLAMVDLLGRQQQGDRMLAQAKQMVAKYADDFNVQVALARAQIAVGETTPARKTLVDASRLAAFASDRQVIVGRLQLSIGDSENAAYSVQKALQDKPDDLAALVLAVEVAARRSDKVGVDAAFKTLVAKHPSSVPTLLTRAHIAMSRGQFAQALTDYRAAMSKEPSTPTALLVVQAQIAGGMARDAVNFLTEWCGKHPEDRIAARGLAEVQVAAGQLDAARATYQRVVQHNPGDATLLVSYAQLLQRLGDPSAAAVAEKALKSAPDNAAAADTLGWILVQRGSLDAGLRYLREARLRSPGVGSVHYHLAAALARSGRKAEAKDELIAALQGPNRVAETTEVARLKNDLGLN